MPFRWRLFQITCILQVLAGLLIALGALVDFLNQGGFWDFVYLLVAVLVIVLASFSITTLNNNYPDKPIQGRTKKIFNRLFLTGFFASLFLFALFFRNWNSVQVVLGILNNNWSELPWQFWSSLLFSGFLLLNHFVILWGLFALRRAILINFSRKKFEFE